MNYRHAFHAGNPGDVLKHVIMASCLAYLGEKPAPYRVLDTHAGIGVYDLSGPQAQRTGEWRLGAAKIAGAGFDAATEQLLAPWRATLAVLNPDGGLTFYPGSPEIARHAMRADDRLLLCELHPEDAATVEATYARDRRVKVVAIDGWTALGAYLPPKERRGLVLIDPPYEEAGEFERLLHGLAAAHKRWPTGTYLLWYPIKNPLDTEAFAERIRRTGIPKMIRAELLVRRPNDTTRMNGAGLIIVNPPYTLAGRLDYALPRLAAAMADGEGARGRVQVLTDEG